MAYKFKIKDGSVENSVRRIADEQIGKALTSIDELDGPEAIHDVRKRCKKFRGLIRIVRPAFDRYSKENAVFRDAARSISDARDAKVMQETYDLLMREFESSVDRSAMGSIRRSFTLRRQTNIEGGEVAEKLDQTADVLREARERASKWKIDADGWDALEGGLTKTYERARHTAEQAESCPDGKNFHELRKRIKYHWYHCRLLENLWPEMIGLRKDTAKQLSDILGDHHDLNVFAEDLGSDIPSFGNPRDVEAAIGLARARQERLEKQAWPMVDRILAQSPEALGEHLEVLWDTWRKVG